jgi:hypothetical protein
VVKNFFGLRVENVSDRHEELHTILEVIADFVAKHEVDYIKRLVISQTPFSETKRNLSLVVGR